MKYKLRPIEIINKQEGEVIYIDKLVEDIKDNNLEEIVEKLLVAKELYLLVINSYRLIETEFIKLMKVEKAKKYENDEVTIIISPQYNYEYFVDKIDSLKNLLPEEKFNEIFTRQYKVNRNVLKGIKTLGGEIKKITEEMEIKNTQKPTVTIIKK